MATIERKELRPPILSQEEAAMAKSAQRCIMAALDHSRAPAIALLDEQNHQAEAAIKLPPQALRLVAQILGAMAEGKPVTVIPGKHEMTTMEAAHFLNVSRPFVIKEIEAGRIPYRKVGTHRRVLYEDLVAYRANMMQGQQDALQRMADEAQDLGLGY
jgi:excisionase family DNA binding protein